MPTYSNTPTVSSAKVGGVKYYLKDVDARAALDTLVNQLKTAAYADYTTTISDTGIKLPTAATVKDYVDAQIGLINKFDVIVCAAAAASIPAGAKYKDGATEITGTMAASADTMYKLYLVKNDDAGAGAFVEYISIRSGTEGAYTYSWEAIGTTAADLANYVLKTTQIAGVAINNGISANDLKTALGLGNFAYANTASGSTSAQTFSTVTASGNISGSASATLTYTSTAVSSTGTFTPAGTVIVTPATTTINQVTNVGSAASLASGFYVAGTAASKAADTFNAGALPSYSHSGFSGGSLSAASTSSFAVSGVNVAIDAEDDECLTFTAATLGTAVIDRGTFTAAVYGTDNFSAGSLPTYTEGAFTPNTPAVIDVSKFNGGSVPTIAAATVVTSASATFAGTVGNISVSGNYDKANSAVTGTVTANNVTLNVSTFTVAAQTITVTP